MMNVLDVLFLIDSKELFLVWIAYVFTDLFYSIFVTSEIEDKDSLVVFNSFEVLLEGNYDKFIENYYLELLFTFF